MSEHINLEYEPDSCVPSSTKQKVENFEKWVFQILENEIKLPAELVYHLVNFHGGIPRKQFFKINKEYYRVICRFCNILKDNDLTPPTIPSWRYGNNHARDVRLDYSIYDLLDADDYGSRLYNSKGLLVPIAALDTAGGFNARGMVEMDLLCLDYESRIEPTVVTWSFEGSWSIPEETKFVANTFAEFLSMLQEMPADYPNDLRKALEVDDEW